MKKNLSLIEGVLENDPVLNDAEKDRIVKCEFKIKTLPRSEKEESLHFNVVTIRRLAEVCHQYLKKNSRVLVAGILREDSEENIIDVSEVNFLLNRQ